MASPVRVGTAQGYIEMANELLKQLKIPKRIYRLEEIGANIFVPLYEGLCGEELPEIKRPATSREEQLINLQAVIDGLSTEVLHVSLSHIRAEDILNGDRTAICNLLEIFQGLMEYLLHHMDSEGSTVGEMDEFTGEEETDSGRRVENRETPTPTSERPYQSHGEDGQDEGEESSHQPHEPADDVRFNGTPHVPGALSAEDFEADLARSRLRRVNLEADEAGCLTDAVAEAMKTRHHREAERAVVLQRRIREYLATRRNDLDLLAGDLRPRAADAAEEEWLEDYLRLARGRVWEGPSRGVALPEEEAESARRLQNLAEEHDDRVGAIKARRKPQTREDGGRRRGPVSEQAVNDRRFAEVSRRSGDIRRDILRDCYDQSLEMVDANEENLLRPRRAKVAGKENAIRAVSEGKGRERPRGTSGLVRPQIRQCARNARPLPHESLAVGEPANLADPDRDILAYLVDQFPYMQLTNETLNELWYRANQQKEKMASAVRQEERRARPMSREEAAMLEAENRQRVLAQILRKELGYNRRLRDKREREAAQRELRARDRDRRMQAARAKKYYDDFVLQMRAKMMHSRDREETLFRKLFKEALHAQRDRINDMRKYSRDVRDRRLAKEMNEIKSLENFYRDRFQILAESLKKERKNITLQDNEQTKVLRQLKKELRGRLEHEIKELQDSVRADQADDYFRERNAERILCDIFRDAPIDVRGWQ